MPARSKPEPKIVEVNASASVGGKIQVKKFEIDSSYYYSLSERWNVEGLTEDEAREFQEEKLAELRARVEPFAQTEADELLDQRSASGT
jgi:ferritin-like protein